MSDLVMQEIADAMLNLPDGASRRDYLRARDLWRPAVLLGLLDAAESLAARDPVRCRRLAGLVLEIAEQMPAPLAAAKARYLQGQSHARVGEFASALTLTAAARADFLALGRTAEAARTYVGEMHALAALGRFDAALAAGEAALRLGGPDGLLPALVAQNQGLVYHRQGRFDRALEAYGRAARLYEELGEARRHGEALNNRGVVLLSLGRGAEAAEAFEQAEAAFAASGATLLAAATRSNQGAAHLLVGQYQQALADLEAARQTLESLDDAETATLMLDTASAYLALNLFPEALGACEEALAAFRAADRPYETGQALLHQAAALQGLGRRAEAEAALAEARSCFVALANAPWEALVRLEQAGLWQLAGRLNEAQEAAGEALAACQAHGMVTQELYAHLRLAELGHGSDLAEQHWQTALDQADKLGVPVLRYRALAGLGRYRRRQGRLDEARELLAEAIALLETQRATLSHELLRASFVGDKQQPFADLIALYLDQNGQEGRQAAFETAERGRARSLLDRLGLPARSDTGPAELVTSVDRLRHELDGLYSAMMAIDLEAPAGSSKERMARRQAIQARIRQTEQQLASLRIRLASRPQDGPAARRAIGLQESLAALPEHTSLVAYQRIDDEWLAFVLEADGLRIVRHLSQADRLAADLEWLALQWSRFRFGPQHIARHRAQVVRSVQARLRRLYDCLIRPLELKSARVVVVPQGPLHSVPFHALYDGQGYWLERVEVAYAPSTSLFAWAEAQPRPAFRRAMAVGLADTGIPQVAGELQAVANAFPEAVVLRDQAATRSALAKAAQGLDLLHIACHGVFRSDNPLFSALRLNDGWLTAADFMQIPTSAGLVILSACESGRNYVAGGDELLGLVRPFLSRAAALIVSLWLVHDRSAARLMEHLLGQLAAGQRPAAALRVAQLQMLQDEPHPYYWAPFIVMGQLSGKEAS